MKLRGERGVFLFVASADLRGKRMASLQVDGVFVVGQEALRGTGFPARLRRRRCPPLKTCSPLLLESLPDHLGCSVCSTDGWGQSEMRHTLLAIRQDYIIEPGERDTIEIAVAQVPERVELRDGTPQPTELAMAVTSALQALQNYRAALMATEA